jgi:hypothetical protein
MNMLSLLPTFGRGRTLARPRSDPFLNLHREINRLLTTRFAALGSQRRRRPGRPSMSAKPARGSR